MRFILVLILCSGYVQAQVGCLVGGYVFGTSTSRSFGRYADMINSQPGVTDKLSNFWFAHGYEVGFEIPNLIVSAGVLNLHYRRMISHTSYTSNTTGKVDFNLRQNQYTASIIIGDVSEKGDLAFFVNVPIGYLSSTINHTIENLPNFRREYSGGQIVMGFGVSSYAMIKRRLGLYLKLLWIGHMIPIKDLKPELFDKSFYDSNNPDMDSYYLNYTYKGENQRVRADFRGISAEIGLIFILFP
ncbi:MAG: hypothetical protein ACK4EX_07610 [Thermaurantimonas sp.]|uniref:hypothetical protein n=1 Tax=Thermaurantimonas sp. TaxID=2681568 RepID=UPI003919C72C